MTAGQRRSPRLEAIIEGKALADVVLATAMDKKALDPAMLAVADVVGYADYFVIVSGRNPRQVRAIADEVRSVMKSKYGRLPVGVEGLETSRWVLVDYGDVVLHVFQEGTRGFYDLEGLWADAPRLPVPEAEAPDHEPPLFTLP